MALINDIYVFVEREEAPRESTVSRHPVEEGLDLTDHVIRSPLTLSISGEIVGGSYEDDVLALERMQKEGELVEYIGVNVLSNALIVKFSTSHTGRIYGGCSFSIDLQEIRIAASPFTAGSGNESVQQIEEAPAPLSQEPPARTHSVKNGDTLWSIAKSYYGNGASFPQIFEANRDKLSDPNQIRAGQILTIP